MEDQRVKDMSIYCAVSYAYNAFDDEFDPYKFQTELIRMGYVVMKL